MVCIFSPFYRLPFCSVDGFLCCAEAFKFEIVTLVYFVACASVIIILKVIVKIYIIELFFSDFFSRSFTVSGLIFFSGFFLEVLQFLVLYLSLYILS